LSIIFGLLAMLGWGVGDFFGAISSRKIGSVKTYFWMRVLGTVLASPFLLISQERSSWQLWFFIPLFISGVLDFIGTISFYNGFNIGNLSVVSPIASSWSVITIILSLIFLNERLSLFQLLAILLIVLGIWLVSFNFNQFFKLRKVDLLKGGKEGLIAMFMWGIMAFLFIFPSKLSASWFLPIMVHRCFLIAIILFYSLIFKQSLLITDDKFKNIKFLLVIGILDLMANFSLNFGAIIGKVSIISPVSSAFGAVTALLGIIFLKEKISASQIFGIISVVGGIIILSV